MRAFRTLTPCLLLALVVLAAGCGGDDGGQPENSTAEVASEPVAAPGTIVFRRLESPSGKVRLYTVRPDGSQLTAITEPPGRDGQDSHPDWSPDGRRIAFRRYSDPGGPNESNDLFVVRADGSGLQNLTGQGCKGGCLGNQEPAWSPDGSRIAFVRTTEPQSEGVRLPSTGVFVMNADGSSARRLTQRDERPGTEDHSPTWSPDGRTIAFIRLNNLAGTGKQNASALFTVPSAGGEPKLLHQMPGEWPGAGAPDWSPDGDRILFSTYCYFRECRQPSTGAQVFTIPRRGGQPQRLTNLPGNSYNPRWSPDGKKITFVRNDKVAPQGDIYTMDADGSNVAPVTSSPELDAHEPDWGALPRD
jgi:Tol biopolymer transport system component